MGLCSGLFKTILFIINISYFIGGAALFSVGIWLAVEEPARGVVDDLNDSAYAVIVGTMIGIGLLLFLTGFFGCCGTCKESTCMLGTYGIFMLCTIAVQITLMVFLGKILDDLKSGKLESVMHEQIRTKYGTAGNEDYTDFWDGWQETLNCCAVKDYRDYQNSTWIGTTTDSVPGTCCKAGNSNANCQTEGNSTVDPNCSGPNPGTGTWVHLNPCGCYKSVYDEISASTSGIIAGVAILCGVEFLAIVIACCVKKNIDETV